MEDRRKIPPRMSICHPDRKHYARGMCRKCYMSAWDKGKVEPKVRKSRETTCHPDRVHVAKGLCQECYDKSRSGRQRELRIFRYHNTMRDNPEKIRRARRKFKYGLTDEDYKQMMTEQQGLCKICKVEPATNIDHCHTTGKVRGILCANCNCGIGYLRDSPEIMRNAVAYLGG